MCYMVCTHAIMMDPYCSGPLNSQQRLRTVVFSAHGSSGTAGTAGLWLGGGYPPYFGQNFRQNFPSDRHGENFHLIVGFALSRRKGNYCACNKRISNNLINYLLLQIRKIDKSLHKMPSIIIKYIISTYLIIIDWLFQPDRKWISLSLKDYIIESVSE